MPGACGWYGARHGDKEELNPPFSVQRFQFSFENELRLLSYSQLSEIGAHRLNTP